MDSSFGLEALAFSKQEQFFAEVALNRLVSTARGAPRSARDARGKTDPRVWLDRVTNSLHVALTFRRLMSEHAYLESNSSVP